MSAAVAIAPRATSREWIGLAVLALPCLLYSMDLTVLNLAVPQISADLRPTSSQLLWIVDIYGFMVAGSSYLVPVSALIFRSQGLQIATVNNGTVTLTPVTAGRDFGEQIEIVSDLTGNESVIVNPPDSIISGQKVQVVQPAAKPAATGGAQ